jgi:hypothetical protein
MTTAFSVQPAPSRVGPSPATVVGIVLVAAIAFVTLVTVGITFASLAIAFPIAVPLAEQFHVAVKPADAALAQQLAGIWPAFVALAIAFFGFALLVVAAAVRALTPSDRS